MIHLWSLYIVSQIIVPIIIFTAGLLLIACLKNVFGQNIQPLHKLYFLTAFCTCFCRWNYVIFSWGCFNLVEWAEDKERTAAFLSRECSLMLYSRAICMEQVHTVFFVFFHLKKLFILCLCGRQQALQFVSQITALNCNSQFPNTSLSPLYVCFYEL